MTVKMLVLFLKNILNVHVLSIDKMSKTNIIAFSVAFSFA